jgi:hypothetical protein
MSRVTLEPHAGRNRPSGWGRKDEEYIADFTLVSKRLLTPEEHDIFRYHYLLGADWKLCTRKLGMDRGNFFHAVYRIEAKLGRGFQELRPYALYPLDEYFHGTSNSFTATAGGGKEAGSNPTLWSGPLKFPSIGRVESN